MKRTPLLTTAAGVLSVRLRQQGQIPLNVAFDVKPGEVVALLGPSGSGKTTTLKAIAGLVVPQQGRVTLGDCVWFDAAQGVSLRPEVRRAGFVFQDYALFPHLSVLGNVSVAMGHVAKQERIAAATAVLERVGIASLAGRSPRALSGGERQRVAMARALARDPKVLLLDEPFSAVDRPTRERLKDEVRALAASVDIPIILVTHDIDEAVALSRRLVVIDGGETVAAGTPDDLFNAPPSARVAEILGQRSAGTTGRARA